MAWIPVAAPIILWTDEVTALSTAPCGDSYTDSRCTWSGRSVTYTDRSKHGTKYSEKGRHGPHDLAPRRCRWRVGVEGLLTIRSTFDKMHSLTVEMAVDMPKPLFAAVSSWLIMISKKLLRLIKALYPK